MLTYDLFYRNSVVRRQSDLNSLHPLSDLVGLPTGSILHLIDHVNMETDEDVSPVPDVTSAAYTLPPDRKWIHNVTNFVMGKNAPVQVDNKNIRLISIGVNTALMKFRAEQMPNVQYVLDPDKFQIRRGIQAIINYNPLFHVRMTGILQRYRLHNLIFASVLNTITSLSDREHFIHVPITSATFTKADFVRAFKVQNRMTLKYPEIPHYLFLTNLLAYIESDSTSSLFEQMPQELMEKVHFFITYGNHYLVYRLDVLKDMNKSGNQILLRTINQLNRLASGDATVISDVSEELGPAAAPEQDAVVKDELVTINVKAGKNITGEQTPVTKEKAKEQTKEIAKTIVKEIDVISTKVIEEDPRLSPAQKVRMKEISSKYKELTLGGVSIEELISEYVDETIEEETTPGLENQIVDKSMVKSSIDRFNSSYIKKTMKRDLASTLTSFHSQGMFLTGLTETPTGDELSHLVEYTANYDAIDGSRHTIKFTLPRVDEYGNCMINGTLKSIRMQRVNTPICKVSPTRIALNTNFNKALVERNVAKAHNFYTRVRAMLEKTEVKWSAVFESVEYLDRPMPYEYSSFARNMKSLTTPAFTWGFRYESRYAGMSNERINELSGLEDKYGVYLGIGGERNERYYFIDVQCVLTVYDKLAKRVIESTTIIDYLTTVLNIPKKMFTEWVEIKGLKGVSKKFPVIFALCYRYGLEYMLKYLHADYAVYEPNERVETKCSDIVLKFKDKKLIIRGVPKTIGLLFSGLTIYDFDEIMLEEMSTKDPYFDMIQQQKLPIYYLRNIDTVMDMFIDPITKDVLAQMGEPTNMKDLLIRCAVLLTTEDHKPAASSTNFRYRSYEVFSAIIYRKLSTALESYKQASIGSSKKFSISNFEIMQEIMADPLMRNVDTINPIADIKDKCGYSHIGEGGRSAEAFVIEDRKYSPDSVGIVSEATVDSGKVAIDAMLSMDPNIVNTRGMIATKDPKDLSATEMLSVTGLLVPGVTSDDGKRSCFANIQMSQYVPTKECHTSRLRTGYERILAHRTRPPFAYAAPQDGVVVSTNEQAGILTVKYKDDTMYALSYGQEYSNNGGGGFYVTQNIAINGYKEGSKFKKGDILIYNRDFFTADPYTKQVDANLGYLANVALMESANTMDDSCILSKNLAESLRTEPVHQRQIVIQASTIIHQIVPVGASVTSATPLLIFDDTEIPTEYSSNPDLLDAIQKLNRSIPKAKHAGKIVKIEAFYRKPINEMSTSLATVVKAIAKTKNAKAKAAAGAANEIVYPKDQPVDRDKLGIVDMDEDTVVLRFYIQQDLPMNSGDKVVFGASLKSVCARIAEEDMVTEDGSLKVQGVLGATSAMNRMVMSVFLTGACNRILEKMEQEMLSMYFD